MAGRKENLKALFTNTRTRVIIVFTAILMLFAVVIGIFKFTKSTPSESAPTAKVGVAPSLQSIPGVLEPTPQYAKLQDEQNRAQAEEAQKKGSSAIPTIIRTQSLGEGMEVVTAEGGQSGVGFVSLSQEPERGQEQTLWLQQVKDAGCSKSSLEKATTRGLTITQLKEACTCLQLRDFGYSLQDLAPVCSCTDLKDMGYKAKDLKESGFSASRLRACGFIACEMRTAGFTAQELMNGGYSAGELKGAGYTEVDISQAGGLPGNMRSEDVLKAGCTPENLAQLRKSGVTAAAIKRITGCNPENLKQAGFTAADLKNAGFSAAELKRANFSPTELHQGGYTAGDLLNAGYNSEELAAAGFTPTQIDQAIKNTSAMVKNRPTDCNPETLRKAKAAGMTALDIKNTLGCPANALSTAGYTPQELYNAGFGPAELKNAGIAAQDLKNAGLDAKALQETGITAQALKAAGFNATALKEAGFSAAALKEAGFNAAAVKEAGFNAAALKEAGFDAAAMKEAAFNAAALKEAGFTQEQLSAAGFTNQQLKEAGFNVPGTALGEFPTTGATKPTTLRSNVQSLTGRNPDIISEAERNRERLDQIMAEQNKRLAEQRLQQNISQRASDMQSVATQYLQAWSTVDTQTYVAGTQVTEQTTQTSTTLTSVNGNIAQTGTQVNGPVTARAPIIKAGDILYAVIETSVDSDEPGPVLATIVSPKLKGARLIGTFNLPANAEKMVINFNTMSVPGAPATTGINAFAIDADTARTALSSRTDHHYLMRYGSLFASSFLEGLGNAIQTANTTITIGGTGGLTNTTVQNTRSGNVTLENAVIALTTVGKNWGQQAQQLFNRPTTVQVFSGTAIGVLFMQDLTTI